MYTYVCNIKNKPTSTSTKNMPKTINPKQLLFASFNKHACLLGVHRQSRWAWHSTIQYIRVHIHCHCFSQITQESWKKRNGLLLFDGTTFFDKILKLHFENFKTYILTKCSRNIIYFLENKSHFLEMVNLG